MTNGSKLLVATIGILVLMWLYDDDNSYASTYCAYGKVFVKFREGGQVWGTLMLDNDGRPMRCLENSISTTKSLRKQPII